jgi:hypothetical protein
MTATGQPQALLVAAAQRLLLPAVAPALVLLLLLLLLLVGQQQLVLPTVLLVHLAVQMCQAAAEASLQEGQCCRCLLPAAAAAPGYLPAAALQAHMQLTEQQQQQQQDVVCRLRYRCRCRAVKALGSTRCRLCRRMWMGALLQLMMMLTMMSLHRGQLTSSGSSSSSFALDDRG